MTHDQTLMRIRALQRQRLGVSQGRLNAHSLLYIPLETRVKPFLILLLTMFRPAFISQNYYAFINFYLAKESIIQHAGSANGPHHADEHSAAMHVCLLHYPHHHRFHTPTIPELCFDHRDFSGPSSRNVAGHRLSKGEA